MSVPLQQKQEITNNLVVLDPKNFTPLSRTPWAGQELSKTIKRHILSDNDFAIGESWEVSCDIEFPSSLYETSPPQSLKSFIDSHHELCLSPEFVAEKGASFDILVKLVNPSKPLSLQIHPADNHKSLLQNECGKPESWLILNAEPGCGVYLGFQPDMTKAQLELKLKSGTFQKEDLHFVPCKEGDYFEIEPGIPHAIGPGVTIFEPQRVQAGKKGVTWRMWDWNRTYNKEGQEDPQGTPRLLNIDQSLELLTTPQKLNGKNLHDAAKRSPEVVTLRPGVVIKYYPANEWYQVTSVYMDMGESIRIEGQFPHGSMTCLAGGINSKSIHDQIVTLPQGFSGFIPNSSIPLEITATISSTHIVIVRANTKLSKNRRFLTSSKK